MIVSYQKFKAYTYHIQRFTIRLRSAETGLTGEVVLEEQIQDMIQIEDHDIMIGMIVEVIDTHQVKSQFLMMIHMQVLDHYFIILIVILVI